VVGRIGRVLSQGMKNRVCKCGHFSSGIAASLSLRSAGGYFLSERYQASYPL
jgi:hypothetical protein